MRLRGTTIGALNMFRTDSGPIGDTDVSAAQALADVATIAIIQHEATLGTQRLNEQLSAALNSRVVVEQAKGKISEAADVDMDQAFLRLRHHARNHNLRLGGLARDIAEGSINPRSFDNRHGAVSRVGAGHDEAGVPAARTPERSASLLGAGRGGWAGGHGALQSPSSRAVTASGLPPTSIQATLGSRCHHTRWRRAKARVRRSASSPASARGTPASRWASSSR